MSYIHRGAPAFPNRLLSQQLPWVTPNSSFNHKAVFCCIMDSNWQPASLQSHLTFVFHLWNCVVFCARRPALSWLRGSTPCALDKVLKYFSVWIYNYYSGQVHYFSTKKQLAFCTVRTVRNYIKNTTLACMTNTNIRCYCKWDMRRLCWFLAPHSEIWASP